MENNENIENVEIRPTIYAQVVGDSAEVQITGSVVEILALFTSLSIDLITKLTEETNEHFVRAMYATMQKEVIDKTCLKKSFDDFKKTDAAMTKSLLKVLLSTIAEAEADDEEDEDDE